MVTELSIRGADKFGTLARTLRQAGDKELRRELYAGINRSVKPLTFAVKTGLDRYLPDRYAAELSKSLRVKTRRRGGRDPSISLRATAKTKQGRERNLRALNRGRLRHMLYGDRRYWYDQAVAPNWWDEPLVDRREIVQRELVAVLDDIAAKVAKKL